MTDGPVLPEPPTPDGLRKLGINDDETRTVTTDETWWRAHKTAGEHVLGWNVFRTFGPILRFDPHPPPKGDHPGHGIWYGAATVDVALGEAYQINRTIDRSKGRPYLTALSFTRTLTVLDLAAGSQGAWATRAGGTFAISTGPHAITQAWARAITTAFPDLDGLRYNGRFAGFGCGGPASALLRRASLTAGHACLALFESAASAMPHRPSLTLPLDHPDLAARIAGAAKRLGYAVI